MIKKFLVVFCLFVLSMHAHTPSPTEKRTICAVVFDFGGVIVQANTHQMAHFLMRTFDINKEELACALKKMHSIGGSEIQFWQHYANIINVTLPPDWFEQFALIIKESLIAIPESLAIVKNLQENGYQTAMLSDVTPYQAEIIRKMGYYDEFHPVLLSYAIGVQNQIPKLLKSS